MTTNLNSTSPLISPSLIESRTQEIGRELLHELRKQNRTSLAGWLNDQITALTLRDENLKVELFRFVDTLPALQTPHAVAEHIHEFAARPNLPLPRSAKKLLHFTHNAVAEHLMSQVAQEATSLMARRFIAGANAREAASAITRLRHASIAFTVDLLGEAVISDSEAQTYQERTLQLLEGLCDLADSWTENEQIDFASFGRVPKVNLSIKLTSLFARFDPMAADESAEEVKKRLRPLLQLAQARGAFINFDAEQYRFRDLTHRVFTEILSEDEFRDWPDCGIVVQAYLRDSEDDLRRLIEWAKRRAAPVWLRLVKGAYWDYETVIAAQHGWPVPVFQDKDQTDANYEHLTALLIENRDYVRPAIATHNVRSAAYALSLIEAHHLPLRTVEFQALYGMGDTIARVLSARGERVRLYVPVGELLPGMAYLVRRLLENTSNDSFVRHVWHDHSHDDELLARPVPLEVRDFPVGQVGTSFRNEPETNFDHTANQALMRGALGTVEKRLGESVPLLVNGQVEEAAHIKERRDPSDNSRLVARVHYANEIQTRRAIDAAAQAFPGWRDTPVETRFALLRDVAAYFRKHRLAIAAWQVYEVGKPWREADADVAEAIDFCEFYTREMQRLAHPHRRDLPGEWNEMIYEPRGVAAVIAPWNFPLAILTGMSVAALVTGNTVVIKPSEQSSRTAWCLMEALQSAGAPPGVVNFVPGEGEVVGRFLVNDLRVATFAFTGSKAVGLEIIKAAANVRPGQSEIKRVIAEMGGKNAVIVDEDADLDEAVQGVLYSAFGYAGQKCSAASRVICVGDVYEPFCRRLADAVRSIRFGAAHDPATQLGPVVDEMAQKRILEYIEIGKAESELLVLHKPPDDLKTQGQFVPAAVFANCPPKGRLCQEEIFGPVLAILPVKTLDEALKLADDSIYWLTGGFYSRSPQNIERARREFRVGNLYINRKTTGALVDKQPFGGHRLSGLGTKAGGPDYLLQFVTPRVITENVLRRGFAPELPSPAGE